MKIKMGHTLINEMVGSTYTIVGKKKDRNDVEIIVLKYGGLGGRQFQVSSKILQKALFTGKVSYA